MPSIADREMMRAPLFYLVSHYPKRTETFIMDEAQALDSDFDVTVVPIVARDPDHLPPESVPLSERVLRVGLVAPVTVRAFARQLLRRPARVFSLIWQLLAAAPASPGAALKALAMLPKAAWLAEHAGARGVVLCHCGFASYPATLAWLAWSLGGPPFSFVAHANDIFKHQYLLAEKLRAAVAVLPISEYNRDFLAAHMADVSTEKLHVIRTGVELQGEYGERENPDVHLSQARLISVGSLLEKKGHDVLLKAIAALRDKGIAVHLDIYGDGEQREALERLIRELHLQANVTLHGGVERATVTAALASADVFALACVEAADGSVDGIPVALMEAMAVGVPVVTTRLRALPELVDGSRTGLLAEPGDAAEFADRLEQVLGDEALRHRLTRAARQHVEAHFDQSVAARNRATVLHAAVDPAVPPADAA